MREGVRESLIGGPASLTGRAPTCSISGSISRAATCGSSKMSAIVFTGPAATKRESVSTISSRGLTALVARKAFVLPELRPADDLTQQAPVLVCRGGDGDLAVFGIEDIEWAE